MIYVVAGFGRCGTSLMMRMLGESGIPLWYDKLLEALLVARNKDSYVINESFLECSPRDYMRLGFTRTVPDGHALKIALRGLPLLAGGVEHKVILMTRDPVDIRQSFITSTLVADFDTQYPSWPHFYTNLLAETRKLLASRRDVDYVEVRFKDLINNPRDEFVRIRGIGIEIGDVEGLVNRNLYRYENEAA